MKPLTGTVALNMDDRLWPEITVELEETVSEILLNRLIKAMGA